MDPAARDHQAQAPSLSGCRPTRLMAKRVCTVSGCPTLTDGGRCDEHRKEADRFRGTATERGYTGAGHRHFRNQILDRDPICVLCGLRESTVADHFPMSRQELIAAGLDPNDPGAGRGLCKQCHDRETARHQPGGWHRPA